MVTEPTVIFASKVPVLAPAQIGTVSLSSLEVKDDDATVILKAAGGKMKFQAKDFAQGGIFQQEPEFGANVEIMHTLGRSCSTSPTSSPGRSTSVTGSTR